MLQDGGLRANNPIEAGLWELDSIWPGHARPGLVLSIGTGCQGAPAHELGHDDRGFWWNRFMPRIVRAFLSSPCLHGQNSWTALLNRLDPGTRDDFFRPNLEFDGEEPALDDVTQVPWLCDLAGAYTLKLEAYRDPIWASAFLYELVEPPTFDHGHYTCQGIIYCSFADARPLLHAIRRAYTRPEIMLDSKTLSRLDVDDVYCPGCDFFQLRTSFEVRHLDANIDLRIAFQDGARRHISTFPNTMQWIVDQQTRDGRLGSWYSVAHCLCSRPTRKRRASRLEGRGPGRGSKRRKQ